MKKISKSRLILNTIISYLFITIGAFIAAFALEAVLVPNSILDGGVTGISIILSILTPFKLSLLIFLINIPFVYIGFKNLGIKFLCKTVYSITMFSLFLELFNHLGYAITDDILLATIYGSALLGVGVGIVIKSGGCLDGTESLGIVVSKNSNISVGRFVLCCNVIIFTVAGYFFGIDRALFSLLAYFITSKVVDLIDEGMDKAKTAMIICDNPNEIAEKIYTSIGRTCTTIKGDGLISGSKTVMYCVLTRIEVNELKRIINEVDDNAFVTITEVSEIIGNHIKSNKARKKVVKKIKKTN